MPFLHWLCSHVQIVSQMSCSMPQLSSKCNKKWKTLNYTQNFLLHCHLLLRPDNLLHNPHSISALKPAPKVLNLSMSETNKKKIGCYFKRLVIFLETKFEFYVWINLIHKHFTSPYYGQKRCCASKKI